MSKRDSWLKNRRVVALGLEQNISRRDFVGSTLIASGAALLGMAAPAVSSTSRYPQNYSLSLAGLGPEWTGPGGVGDYGGANGNTHGVVNAAHAVRNGEFARRLRRASDTGESYDLVVVGGGFAGLASAHTFLQERPRARVLVIDNHSIFGGEAKQNEFEVDGYRLWGPQGSTGNAAPRMLPRGVTVAPTFWDEIGLPPLETLKYQTVEASDILVPKDIWRPMHAAWEEADHGWFMGSRGWVRNPWSDGFRNTPIDEQFKRDLLTAELYRTPPRRSDWPQFLDSMTYQQFLQNIVGVSEKVGDYVSPAIAVQGSGLGADVCSAYCAVMFPNPGPVSYRRLQGRGEPVDYNDIHSFPGGNTGTIRKLVKRLNPAAISGGESLTDVLLGTVNFDALDRPNIPARIRLSATAVDVRHHASAGLKDRVHVTYLKDGQLHRVTAAATVMAGGQWINKHVVADATPELTAAMAEFHHAPVLTVNVAVRHWRFMNKLGIAAARWFEGFGWFTTLRRQMLIDGRAPMPLHPDKPTVLTLFIPFLLPGTEVGPQAAAARMQLFSMSYRDIELKIREQFDLLFRDAGFDAARDIAAITTNRWGHAYVVQPPGFYFGRNGRPPAREVVQSGYGAVQFAHAELQGAQAWDGAVAEGQRAARQLLNT